MKIYKIEEILNKLENCIVYKRPFSHIRFGDGGIKYIHAVLFDDIDQLDIIVKKEGIPRTKILEVFELWGHYARSADFIDTPEVYFTGDFWPRIRRLGKPITEKTHARLMMWKDLYSRAEFDNERYCNPESNYLMILRLEGKRNILDIMKGKKIGLITARPEVRGRLKDFDITIVDIVGHYQNQYKNSFSKVVKQIEETARDYDFWLVAAGELGRLYSGIIKKNGGRCIDIGFVIEYWLGEDIHPRFTSFLRKSNMNNLELRLTNLGKNYEEYI
jgi:hypothetical protein